MIFELSWSWYGEYRPRLLEHPTKTKKQFFIDVEKIYRDVGEEYLKQEDSYINISTWTKAVYLRLLKIGYKEVKPIVFNVTKIYIDKNNLIDNYSDIEKFKKIIGNKLWSKITEHNDILEKKLK